MNGKSLKKLASIADLSKLDLEASAITLKCDPERSSAYYTGEYSGGWCRVENGVEEAFEIALSAAQFKSLAEVFSDDDTIRLSTSDLALMLKSKASAIKLVKINSPVPFNAESGKLLASARMKAATLISEVTLASEFTSSSFSNRMLNGVKLDFEEDHVRFSAYDGFGVMYESRVDAKVKKSGTLVIPKPEFLHGSKLAADEAENITLGMGENHFEIQGEQMFFRSSTFAGPWTNTDKSDRQTRVCNGI